MDTFFQIDDFDIKEDDSELGEKNYFINIYYEDQKYCYRMYFYENSIKIHHIYNKYFIDDINYNKNFIGDSTILLKYKNKCNYAYDFNYLKLERI